MKHLLFIIGLAFTLNASAQKVDSIPLAIQIKPLVINAIKKDTAYQVTWRGIDIVNDTTKSLTTYVQVWDRQGRQVGESNVIVPAEIVRQWMNKGRYAIDNFILTFYGLVKR